jgi:hypothetical protein
VITVFERNGPEANRQVHIFKTGSRIGVNWGCHGGVGNGNAELSNDWIEQSLLARELIQCHTDETVLSYTAATSITSLFSVV